MRQRLHDVARIAAPAQRVEQRHQARGEGRNRLEIAEAAAAQRVDQRLGADDADLLARAADRRNFARGGLAHRFRSTILPPSSSSTRSAKRSTEGW